MKIKIAHIFASKNFETRGRKFVESLEKEGFCVQKILKKNSESYFTFLVRSVLEIYRSEPDIIHSHRISGFIPSIISKLMKPRIKIIYDKHDIHKYDFIFDNLAFMADYILVASDLHMKRMLKKHKNVEVIHNYSNFVRASKKEISKIRKGLGIKREETLIMFQGSIIPEYGLDMILRALQLVKKNVKLLIIGWIKDKNYWKKCQRYFNDRVIYLGPKNYEEMKKFISASDIGVVLFQKTKLTEYGNPNKLFEFFACKVPVIVTDVSSLKTYINNGKNGFIIRNYKELAEAIEKLTNKKLRENFIRNLPKLSWETEFKKYLDIINKLKR
jgi:glycosyltransferase involved in cell wall biosynthesis